MSARRQSSYPLIASLYVSQAIPLGFFTIAMPAILRQRGLSLESVGLLSALATPWLFKFLWAPFLDRYGSRRIGHYRSWIFPLQALSVGCVLVIASLDIATQMGPLLVAGAAFMLLSATQDVATDGLAVRALTVTQRGMGNGIQVGGYYLGQILGGGAMLLLFQRFGWTVALLAMASFLALPVVPALRYREPAPAPDERPRRTVDYGAIARFFTRPGTAAWLVALTMFRAGEMGAQTMLNPMLVDLGYELEEIGLMLGVAGSFAALAGALAGGAWIRRVGRKRSLVTFVGLEAIAAAIYATLASGAAGTATVWIGAMAMPLAGGMATAALYTQMMDRCDGATGATDFSLQQSLAVVGAIVAASFSGFSASALGYAGHFLLCGALALAVAAWIAATLTVEELPAHEEKEAA